MKAPLLAANGFDSSKLDQLTSADMRAVGRVYAGWGLSQAYYREELYLELGYDSLADFVAGVWENSFMRMDPHNVLAMLWTGQNAEKALNSIKAHACVMPGSTDLFCTADDNEYEAKLIPTAAVLF